MQRAYPAELLEHPVYTLSYADQWEVQNIDTRSAKLLIVYKMVLSATPILNCWLFLGIIEDVCMNTICLLWLTSLTAPSSSLSFTLTIIAIDTPIVYKHKHKYTDCLFSKTWANNFHNDPVKLTSVSYCISIYIVTCRLWCCWWETCRNQLVSTEQCCTFSVNWFTCRSRIFLKSENWHRNNRLHVINLEN